MLRRGYGGIRDELAAGVSRAIFAGSIVKHRTDDDSQNAQAWIAREGQCPHIESSAGPGRKAQRGFYQVRD